MASLDDLVLIADWLLPISADPIQGGWLSIKDGRITGFGQGPTPQSTETRSFEGGMILPGLINAHTHLGCSFLEGKATDLGFLDWLDGRITPQVIDAYLGPRAGAQRANMMAHAKRAAAWMSRTGTTTVVDSFFDSIGHEVLVEQGLRGVYCREYFGSRSDDLPQYADDMRSRCSQDVERFTQGLATFGLAPHALYTCPRDVLLSVFDRARELDIPVTIHLAESQEERAFFMTGGGPMRELFAPGDYKDRYDFGKSPVRNMYDLGLLDSRVALVHMVHVDEEDLDLVAESGATVVHCPGSNAGLSVGCAPVAAMLNRGIPVALGTDSLASTFSMSLFDEMRNALLFHRLTFGDVQGLDVQAIFKMATLGGARASGLADEVGSLDVGKWADLVVMGPATTNSSSAMIEEPYSWALSSLSEVVSTYVAGREVIDSTSSPQK